MRLPSRISTVALSSCLAVSLWLAAPAVSFAQGMPSVSTVTLQVVPGQNGMQSVLTPKGLVVPLPGAGVNSNCVQIYMGSQGGFWYTDRNGQTVDLTQAVMQYRAATGQAPNTMQVPQYAPVPPPVQQAPSSGSGGSAAGTAAVAGLGAMAGSMAGSAIANSSYNNVPYGTPMYYNHSGQPYYHAPNGSTVNVPPSSTYNQAYYNQHSQNLEQQQQYYAKTQQSNPEQYKSWQQTANQNPFVSQAYSGGGSPQGYNAANAQNSQYAKNAQSEQNAQKAQNEQYAKDTQNEQNAKKAQNEQYAKDAENKSNESGGGRRRRGGGSEPTPGQAEASGETAKSNADKSEEGGKRGLRRGGSSGEQSHPEGEEGRKRRR